MFVNCSSMLSLRRGPFVRILTVLGATADFALLATSCDSPAVGREIEFSKAASCADLSCTSDGMCAIDPHGAPACVCEIGYGGPTCAQCDTDYHRDAQNRCVTDKLCAEQTTDPCAPNGQCRDNDGVITCACDEGFDGPRCSLCAGELVHATPTVCSMATLPKDAGMSAVKSDAGTPPSSRDSGAPMPKDAGTDAGSHSDTGSQSDAGGGGTTDAAVDGSAGGPQDAGPSVSDSGANIPDAAIVVDAGSQQADAGTDTGPQNCAQNPGSPGCGCTPPTISENFDAQPGWPSTPNTCATKLELVTSGFTFRSRAPRGNIYLCAPSNYNAFGTAHIELEANDSDGAEIVFQQPVVSVQLEYSATLDTIDVEVMAGGSVLRTLSAPEQHGGKLEVSLAAPATSLVLRSRSPYIQRVRLDNLSYATAVCK